MGGAAAWHPPCLFGCEERFGDCAEIAATLLGQRAPSVGVRTEPVLSWDTAGADAQEYEPSWSGYKRRILLAVRMSTRD